MVEITQEDIEKTREIYELIERRAEIKLQIEHPSFSWDDSHLRGWDSEGIWFKFEKWHQYDDDYESVLIKEYELLLTEQEFRQITIDRVNVKTEAERQKRITEQQRQEAWQLKLELETYERLKEKFGNETPD